MRRYVIVQKQGPRVTRLTRQLFQSMAEAWDYCGKLHEAFPSCAYSVEEVDETPAAA